jgi:hypothetical protein
MTIEALWKDYRSKVMPPVVSEIQEIECRRAFYAGVMGGFGEIYSVANKLPEDEAVAWANGILAEAQAFAKSELARGNR